MTNTTPQAAEAARLAGEARVLAAKLFDGTTAGTTEVFAPLLVAIDRLRDLASRADSPAGEALSAPDTRKVYAGLMDQSGDPTVEAKSTAAEVTAPGDEGVACKTDGRRCSTYVECAATGCRRASPSEAQAAPLHAYLSKLPALDPTWPEQIQEGWMKCFDALRSMSASEAQKAVAEWVNVEQGFQALVPTSELADQTLLYTHPSAGAGAEPQEVAMLRAEVSRLTAERDAAREDARRYAFLRNNFMGADFEWGRDDDLEVPGTQVLLVLWTGGPVYGCLDATLDKHHDSAMNPSTQEQT